MAPEGISSYRPPIMGVNHVVASGHYLAASVGYRILEEGGNAIDAGVASGIAINATLPDATSFAGVAPIIIYLADKDQVVTISGLGRWPHAVTLDHYVREYGKIPIGVLRSVVPSACDAWLTALERFGTMSFERVVAPSVTLADEGFPMSPFVARSIVESQDVLSRWESSRGILMPNGRPIKAGERFVQKDLASVFQQMIGVERANVHKGRGAAIRAARDFFYKGDIAGQMVDFCQREGGLLTLEDFSQFHVKVEPPEIGQYKEYTLYTCGPWCQGPSLIQSLHMVEGFDLKEMGHNSPDYIHTVVETIKLAFADRHAYYGDPDMVEVPMKGLLSKEYAAQRRELICPDEAWPEMPPAGTPWAYQEGTGTVGGVPPPQPRPGPQELDTSYTCVVDRWGNAFSATPSDTFAGTPMVPGLGMIISSRGTQTWLEPGHPSALAPWKRPRLTPNPALVFKDGKLFMPFGTPGGDNQVQGMTQMFLNIVEFGMDPQQAVEAPRFASDSFPNSFWPHTYLPGRMAVEGRIPPATAEALTKRGHRVDVRTQWAPLATGLCGIVIDRERGILLGGADPRRDSYVIGR